MSSSVLSVSEKVSKGAVSVNFNVNITKKSTAATVLIEFPGDKSLLLSKILHQFCEEHNLPVVEHAKAHIYGAICGFNVVSFMCPDTKVLSNILLVYQFILKHKINPQLLKNINPKTDGYDKLYQKIKSINVVVTGKCKSTFNVVSSKHPKLNLCVELLDKLYSSLNGKQKLPNVPKTGDVLKCYLELASAPANKDLFGLYLAIVLGETPCAASLSGSTVTLEFIDSNRAGWNTLNKSIFKNKIKAFLSQFGAIGSEPDAKEVEKVKAWKAKSKTILESLTITSEVVCRLHGLKPCVLNNAEEAKAVNADILKLIKACKIRYD